MLLSGRTIEGMGVTAVEAARGILEEYWWAWEGHGTLPVDPVKIAHRMGIEVRMAALDPDMSGAIIGDPGEYPKILINSRDGEDRRRFTVSHELGHWADRIARGEDGVEIGFVDYRDTLYSASGNSPDEVFANGFAAELLMPEPLVRLLVDDGWEQWRLAKKFGVSPAAMGVRLANLKLRG